MKTILLVNNDTAALNSLAEFLRRCRYEVIARQDGASAIEKIAEGERIDLLITDHRMDDMGDLEVLQALRKTWPDVPAIILTEQGTLSSYLKAIGLGVTAYLESTGGNRELLRIIADTLGDSAKEKSGSICANAHSEAGIRSGTTVFDRGYADVMQY